MIIRHKEIQEKWPENLERTVKWIKEYPKSIRLANELRELGINLIKQNNLYIPFFKYAAQLTYKPKDDSGSQILTFRKYKKADLVAIAIETKEAQFGIAIHSVDVYDEFIKRAGMGHIVDPETKYASIEDYIKSHKGNAPIEVIISRPDKKPWSEEFTCYDLLFDSPPRTIKMTAGLASLVMPEKK